MNAVAAGLGVELALVRRDNSGLPVFGGHTTATSDEDHHKSIGMEFIQMTNPPPSSRHPQPAISIRHITHEAAARGARRLLTNKLAPRTRTTPPAAAGAITKQNTLVVAAPALEARLLKRTPLRRQRRPRPPQPIFVLLVLLVPRHDLPLRPSREPHALDPLLAPLAPPSPSYLVVPFVHLEIRGHIRYHKSYLLSLNFSLTLSITGCTVVMSSSSSKIQHVS